MLCNVEFRDETFNGCCVNNSRGMLESMIDLASRRKSLIFDEVTDLMKHESLLVGRYRAPS